VVVKFSRLKSHNKAARPALRAVCGEVGFWRGTVHSPSLIPTNSH
jgi:hypothetical protein